MPLPRAPLLLWGAALGYFVVGAFCGSPTHSLCYFYLKLSEPSQGLPQFFIRGYLDDQPIARYDSLTGKMEPLVPWVEEKEKETFRVLEWVFGAALEKLSQLSQLTRGLHTWQLVLGCELRQDWSKGAFLLYGYDGMDFLSFDKETLRWVAAHPQAKKVKQKWEEDSWGSQRTKIFLEKTCIEWLQKYLSYQKKEPLQRTEPPAGKVTWKVVDDSLEVLTCQAFGFYPKEIWATWTRDGEFWEHETLRGTVAPNSDGTYYVRLSIEIDPKERDHFRCHLEHEGLQGPLVLAFKEETARIRWIPVGTVVAIISGAGILVLINKRRRCRKKFHRKVTTRPDQVSLDKLPSPPINGTEDETQSQLMFQPQVSSEHNTTCGGRRPKRTLEDILSTLPDGEWKQFITAALDALDAEADADVAAFDGAFDAFASLRDAGLDAASALAAFDADAATALRDAVLDAVAALRNALLNAADVHAAFCVAFDAFCAAFHAIGDAFNAPFAAAAALRDAGLDAAFAAFAALRDAGLDAADVLAAFDAAAALRDAVLDADAALRDAVLDAAAAHAAFCAAFAAFRAPFRAFDAALVAFDRAALHDAGLDAAFAAFHAAFRAFDAAD